LANFDFDQAEGLRRMLAGPKQRVVTFLSGSEQEDRGAMLVNLCASLSHAGSDVLLVDACGHANGVASRLGVAKGGALLNVARQECGLNQVVRAVPQGFNVAALAEHPLRAKYMGNAELRRLANTFDVLVKQSSGIVVVDGELDEENRFPVAAMGDNDIVVQVSNSAISIKAAYSLIKRMSQELGRRPFGLLVTGANESEAKLVYDNMAQATSRYLAVKLISMGSVPADEYVSKAARLGRAVIDAYPLAGASIAYRRLAGRLSLSGTPSMKRSYSLNHSSHVGT
jgi:flagellar biosynthesis protein FlhG